MGFLGVVLRFLSSIFLVILVRCVPCFSFVVVFLPCGDRRKPEVLMYIAVTLRVKSRW